MCIVALAWHLLPDTKVALLNNRDEFLARPTLPLHVWPSSGIIAGQDMTAGGTWLGMTASGRWAVLTNMREPQYPLTGREKSRGQLVQNYLTGFLSPLEFAKTIALTDFAGFNLVLGNLQQAVLVNNRGVAPTPLAPGLYAFSNGQPTEHWFKTERLRRRVMQEVLPIYQAQHSPQIYTLTDWQQAAFNVLQDNTVATLDTVQHTGLPESIELALSAIFVDLPQQAYGTRSSSILTMTNQGYDFIEKTHRATHQTHAKQPVVHLKNNWPVTID